MYGWAKSKSSFLSRLRCPESGHVLHMPGLFSGVAQQASSVTGDISNRFSSHRSHERMSFSSNSVQSNFPLEAMINWPRENKGRIVARIAAR
jgi:hypothetical protein